MADQGWPIPSAVRLLAGRRSEAVPTARLTDLLRAAGISLAVVAATASAEWAAVALGANKAAWNAGTGVQVGLLAAFSAAAAGCAGGIGKASAALRRARRGGPGGRGGLPPRHGKRGPARAVGPCPVR